MVCIYCSSATQVINSRLQKRSNQVWRRRSCLTCGNTFTTHERADLSGSIAVRYTKRDIRPFSRDTLFISLYECCKHRPHAVEDAVGLAQTVTDRLVGAISDGAIDRRTIVLTTAEVLGHFDKTAAAVYTAFHKTELRG